MSTGPGHARDQNARSAPRRRTRIGNPDPSDRPRPPARVIASCHGHDRPFPPPRPPQDRRSRASTSRPRSARLKRERNAVILAHYYQDSRDPGPRRLRRRLAAALAAGGQDEGRRDRLLRRPLHGRDGEDPEPRQDGRGPRPRRGLLARRRLPAPTCSRSGSKQYPGHTVVSYINCSAAVKALLDDHLHVVATPCAS